MDLKPAPKRINGMSPSLLKAVCGCNEIQAVVNSQCGITPFYVPAGALGFPVLQVAMPDINGQPPEPFVLIYWPDFTNEAGMIMLSAHKPSHIQPTGRHVK